MMKLMQDRPAINVVNDQVGAPTYAADLAKCMMEIVAGDHSSKATGFPGSIITATGAA